MKLQEIIMQNTSRDWKLWKDCFWPSISPSPPLSARTLTHFLLPYPNLGSTYKRILFRNESSNIVMQSEKNSGSWEVGGEEKIWRNQSWERDKNRTGGEGKGLYWISPIALARDGYQQIDRARERKRESNFPGILIGSFPGLLATSNHPGYLQKSSDGRRHDGRRKGALGGENRVNLKGVVVQESTLLENLSCH